MPPTTRLQCRPPGRRFGNRISEASRRGQTVSATRRHEDAAHRISGRCWFRAACCASTKQRGVGEAFPGLIHDLDGSRNLRVTEIVDRLHRLQLTKHPIRDGTPALEMIARTSNFPIGQSGHDVGSGSGSHGSVFVGVWFPDPHGRQPDETPASAQFPGVTTEARPASSATNDGMSSRPPPWGHPDDAGGNRTSTPPRLSNGGDMRHLRHAHHEPVALMPIATNFLRPRA